MTFVLYITIIKIEACRLGRDDSYAAFHNHNRTPLKSTYYRLYSNARTLVAVLFIKCMWWSFCYTATGRKREDNARSTAVACSHARRSYSSVAANYESRARFQAYQCAFRAFFGPGGGQLLHAVIQKLQFAVCPIAVFDKAGSRCEYKISTV